MADLAAVGWSQPPPAQREDISIIPYYSTSDEAFWGDPVIGSLVGLVQKLNVSGVSLLGRLATTTEEVHSLSAVFEVPSHEPFQMVDAILPGKLGSALAAWPLPVNLGKRLIALEDDPAVMGKVAELFKGVECKPRKFASFLEDRGPAAPAVASEMFIGLFKYHSVSDMAFVPVLVIGSPIGCLNLDLFIHSRSAGRTLTPNLVAQLAQQKRLLQEDLEELAHRLMLGLMSVVMKEESEADILSLAVHTTCHAESQSTAYGGSVASCHIGISPLVYMDYDRVTPHSMAVNAAHLPSGTPGLSLFVKDHVLGGLYLWTSPQPGPEHAPSVFTSDNEGIMHRMTMRPPAKIITAEAWRSSDGVERSYAISDLVAAAQIPHGTLARLAVLAYRPPDDPRAHKILFPSLMSA